MKLLTVALLLVLVAGPALGETETCLDFECPNEEMDGGKFAVSRFSCFLFCRFVCFLQFDWYFEIQQESTQVGPCNGDFCYCSYGKFKIQSDEAKRVFEIIMKEREFKF